MTPSREPALPTPRRNFTKRERIQVHTEQNGACANCPALLLVSFPIDHILPLELGGTYERENLAGLCIPCHKVKTRADIKRIAKARRLRRKADPDTRKRPARPIRSAGFRKHPTLVRGFDHKVKLRTRKDHP